ncbi:class I adenylate-forming enzyme family protein [Muricoccus vinaceus]|uniref:Class I adenylate-forming enzyme family protein n=1 Tax=Muricoccus vinaceus TaxID=424704 RepID=A0ABV6ISG2_9PROT
MLNVTHLDRLFDKFRIYADRRAVVEGDYQYSYSALAQAVEEATEALDHHAVQAGAVVGLQAEFSFAAIAMALALFRRRAVAVFISPNLPNPLPLLEETSAEGIFSWDADGARFFRPLKEHAPHLLLRKLRQEGRSGFVVFTSGSGGKPKAVLHDLERFLERYSGALKPYTTMAFLLFDHIAGIDTMFYTLHAGGDLVLVKNRRPGEIINLIERWSVAVLPVSPSFLKLMCMGEIPHGVDLTSLKIITFGSEPIDLATLTSVQQIFPNVKISQKYGASEFGAPRAQTRGDDSRWIKLQSRTVHTRIVDSVLWLKSPTTMLGYLNSDNSVLHDGWFCTGDLVEIEGDWIRVLGRQSDIINVGGEKVFPAEVEAVVQELEDVIEVAVSGEPHPMLGEIVTASVRIAAGGVDDTTLRKLVRQHCLGRLERYKVPVKITSTTKSLVNDRQKVVR